MLQSSVLRRLQLASRDLSIIRIRACSNHGVPRHVNAEANRGSPVIEQPVKWTGRRARTRSELTAGTRPGLDAATVSGLEAGTRMGRQLLAKGKSKARSNAERSKNAARFIYDWMNPIPETDLDGFLPPTRYVGQQNMVRPRALLHPL